MWAYGTRHNTHTQKGKTQKNAGGGMIFRVPVGCSKFVALEMTLMVKFVRAGFFLGWVNVEKAYWFYRNGLEVGQLGTILQAKAC